MTLSIIHGNYLWELLTSNQVQNIETTIFVEASPQETKLPDTICPQAVTLLKKLKGRIFPIALRGKSQAGKSTTLNRIAAITNFSSQKWLPVGEKFGSTTTYGIWLMIITFKNDDALLLFDVQGTDRGADEVTYKLIAFTDHICTKVIDAFRMPSEGFSNEYIDSLDCLSKSRDSVTNLIPTSNKAILWTNCVLPKESPFGRKSCEKPDEYHLAVLQDVVGVRMKQAEKAKEYTEQTPILTTTKPTDEIITKISQLDNDNPFIEKNLIPIIRNMLSNIEPFKIQSIEIKGTNGYVQYLEKIYGCIKLCNIDLPFCQSAIITSIILSNLEEQKQWIKDQLEQIKQRYSENRNWIENHSKEELDNITNQCIQQFENALSSLTRNDWKDHLEDLKHFIQNRTKELTDQFKTSMLPMFWEEKYLTLHHSCTLGHTSDILRNELDKKKNEIMRQLRNTPLFKNNLSDIESALLEERLDLRIAELVFIQQSIENKWLDLENEFERKMYPLEEDAINQSIDNLIQNLHDFSFQKFEKFRITSKIFFNVSKKKKNSNNVIVIV